MCVSFIYEIYVGPPYISKGFPILCVMRYIYIAVISCLVVRLFLFIYFSLLSSLLVCIYTKSVKRPLQSFCGWTDHPTKLIKRMPLCSAPVVLYTVSARLGYISIYAAHNLAVAALGLRVSSSYIWRGPTWTSSLRVPLESWGQAGSTGNKKLAGESNPSRH